MQHEGHVTIPLPHFTNDTAAPHPLVNQSSIVPHNVELDAATDGVYSLHITKPLHASSSQPALSLDSPAATATSPDVLVVVKLRQKISELYADIETLRCEHAQSTERQSDLEQEVASLKRSKAWYSEQLNQLQTTACMVNATESPEVTNLLKQTESANHKLTHNNACLQAQLACSRASLIEAKRLMSHQLVGIQSDMIERESLYQRLSADRAQLQEANSAGREQVRLMQDRHLSLVQEYESLQLDVTGKEGQIEGLKRALGDADARCKALQKELTRQAATDQARIDELQKQVDELASVDQIKNALVKALKEKDELLLMAQEEKLYIESALDAANQEKATLDACMTELKLNLSKVDEHLQDLKSELKTKADQLAELTVTNHQLNSENVVLKDQLTETLSSNNLLNNQLIDAQNRISNLQYQCDKFHSDLSSINAAIGQSSYSLESVKHSLNTNGSPVQPLRSSAELPGYVDQHNTKKSEMTPLAHYFSSSKSTDNLFNPNADGQNDHRMPFLGVQKESVQPCMSAAPPTMQNGSPVWSHPTDISATVQYLANEASEALVSLSGAQQSLASQTECARREAEARRREAEEHKATKAELEAVQKQLFEIQAQFIQSKRAEKERGIAVESEYHQAQEIARKNSDELEALKALIKTTTDHLAATTAALEAANREKVSYQCQLADLRGAVRAYAEQHPDLVNPLSTTDSNTLLTSWSSVGMSLGELKQLLGPTGQLPLEESKPLYTITSCFESLQQEIAALESEVVDHTLAVRDAIPSAV